MFCDYAASSSVRLLLAVKLKPFSWNVLGGKKKERDKVIVSVENTLFVFSVMQTVITTTAFFPGICRSVDFFPPSVDSELHTQICYKLPLFFFFL